MYRFVVDVISLAKSVSPQNFTDSSMAPGEIEYYVHGLTD